MGALTDYLAGLDPETRVAFERVRAPAEEVAPEAVEGTGYGMAALRLGGFSLSTGTIRSSADHPMPDDGVRDVVRLRVEEITGSPRSGR